MNKLIGYIISFVITGVILYIIGFILAVCFLSLVLLVKSVTIYYKKRRRFSEWEFSQFLPSNHITIKDKIVVQKVKEVKRLDRKLDVWEIKTVAEPISQIYYTGKIDKHTKLDDIFNLYYRP